MIQFMTAMDGGTIALESLAELCLFDARLGDEQLNLAARVLGILSATTSDEQPEVSIEDPHAHVGYMSAPILRIQHETDFGDVEVLIDSHASTVFRAGHVGEPDVGLAMLAAWAGGAK